MYCTLSSEHFCYSSLVQGGLEIECQALIETRATKLRARLTGPYLDLVKDLYMEPTEAIAAYSSHTASPSQKKDKVCIHYCFKESGYLKNVRSAQEEKNTKCYCT